jgi:hypothetical protein
LSSISHANRRASRRSAANRSSIAWHPKADRIAALTCAYVVGLTGFEPATT